MGGNAHGWRPATARLRRALPAVRRRLPPVRPSPLIATTGLLLVVGLGVAWMGQHADAVAVGRPNVAWELSAASNTVTVRLTAGRGPLGRRVMARSHLTVVEGDRRLRGRAAASGAAVRVPVPPGRVTHLVVLVRGPQPFRRVLTVTVPPALRVTASRRTPHGLLVRVSSPLRRRPRKLLCGTDRISFLTPDQVEVAKGPEGCRAWLRLTARDGEQAVVPVNVPALRSPMPASPG